jgi:hypothetical protein
MGNSLDFNPPLRVCYSKEEMLIEIKNFMKDRYGLCRHVENKDKWYEKYGLLIDFADGLFPETDLETGTEKG